MKILLAIDDSAHSEAATEMVRKTARPAETEVRVLHENEPIIFPPDAQTWTSATIYSEMAEEQRRLALKIVKGAEETMRGAGFKQVSHAIVEGNAKGVIVEQADVWGADLIVLGSHGRKGLDRFLLGSVSDAVARHATCSVEIVRVRTE